MDEKTDNISWFWSHRRNASLNHLSMIMHGMSGKGWMPAVNFWFDNQIVIGVPKKGSYIFYDKDQLCSKNKFRDIQESIGKNPNFIENFRDRTDELYGVLFLKSMDIDDANLGVLSKDELSVLFDAYAESILKSPIITVQLWGIEACVDDSYCIMTFLRSRLKELGKSDELQHFKEILATNPGETVAMTEKKNFLQVASAIDTAKTRKVFKNKDLRDICASLESKEFAFENSIIENHMSQYEWMNAEFTSGGWSKEKWLQLFIDALKDKKSPKEKLDELKCEFDDQNKRREDAIKVLDPPKNVLHAIRCYGEFIAQRDWSKGYLTKSLLSYHRLLDEIASRIGITREDLFEHSYLEIREYFRSSTTLSREEIENRKKSGFAIVIKGGDLSIATGQANIQEIIEIEEISAPFEKIEKTQNINGLGASRGKIKGRVRLLEDASKIDEFKKGEILVTYMTTMEFTPFFRKAAAVITDEGGMSCHAAIVSREFKLPCVVGTQIATRALQTGDFVEVDGGEGIVKVINDL